MRKKIRYISFLPIYLLVLSVSFLIAISGSHTVTVLSASAPISGRHVIVIDAGHGGVDGGATSCTGVLESQFNLDIAIRLNDFMHFLGLETIMIRDTDRSVYTEGNTIAQKKVSDLKERVRIVNSTENAILISIHQNQFSDGKYSGAQVFYANTDGSKSLASQLQTGFISAVNPTSHRQIKKADKIYLMQHISCPAVLIECGFLSNPQEEYLLRTASYQQKLCAVIGCTVSAFLFQT